MFLRAALRVLPTRVAAIAPLCVPLATVPVASRAGTDAASGPGASAPDPGAPSRELLLELCETTRLAGTRASQVAAVHVAHRLEAAGWTAEIEPRVVMLTYPRRTEIEVYDRGAAKPISWMLCRARGLRRRSAGVSSITRARCRL